ncbi:MAG: small basic family protein [Candidatus Sericytochromatia bacterium]
MWIVVISLILGMIIGFLSPFSIPVELSKYFAVSILAGLDTSIGGLRAGIEKHFRLSIFISGFTFNIFLAAILVYLGDLLGIDLYLAAILVFGMRLFNNITFIRRDFLDKLWIIPKSEREKNKTLVNNDNLVIKNPDKPIEVN